MHVLDANTVPESFNPNDTISGYAGIPTRMTTIAHKMKSAGYATHFVGQYSSSIHHRRPLAQNDGLMECLLQANGEEPFILEMVMPRCSAFC